MRAGETSARAIRRRSSRTRQDCEEMHRTMRTALLTVLVGATLMSATLVRSQEPLQALEPTTPALAAVLSWHRAMVRGDFDAYQKISATTRLDVSQQRQVFNHQKKWVPSLIKVTTPRLLPNGNVELSAVGCTNGRRQVANVIVVNANGVWRVLDTGWADVWGPAVKACPV